MKVLGLCGNLQRSSREKQLLLAALAHCRADEELAISAWIGALPHFNVELDRGGIVPVVATWREQVKQADALLIVTPSCLEGVPGGLKNALDWLESGTELAEKPVAILQTEGREAGSRACLDALSRSLRSARARVVSEELVATPGDTTLPSSELQLALEALRSHELGKVR